MRLMMFLYNRIYFSAYISLYEKNFIDHDWLIRPGLDLYKSPNFSYNRHLSDEK